MPLSPNVQSVVVDIATEIKALRTLLNNNQPTNVALLTTAKGNLVAAINELHGLIANASGIDDTQVLTNKVWSSSKTNTEITNKINALVASAPGLLDTLDEIAAAIGDDPNFAATITAALGNRLRVDAAQTLTGPQMTQGLANLGAAPVSHTHTAVQISDSSATGRALIAAADATAARTAIGAGTSNLVLGTAAGTAKAGDYAPPVASEAAPGLVELATTTEAATGTDTTRAITAAGLKVVADGKAPTTHTHTVAQLSDASATTRTFLQAATAAAARTAIGAGTSSLAIGTTAGTAADAAAVGPTETDYVAIFRAALV